MLLCSGLDLSSWGFLRNGSCEFGGELGLITSQYWARFGFELESRFKREGDLSRSLEVSSSGSGDRVGDRAGERIVSTWTIALSRKFSMGGSCFVSSSNELFDSRSLDFSSRELSEWTLSTEPVELLLERRLESSMAESKDSLLRVRANFRVTGAPGGANVAM